MKHPVMPTAWKALMMAVLVIAFLASVATNAGALTDDEVLGLQALQDKLESGPVAGYFETVVKGKTVESYTVDILAITGDADPSSTLIMFESTDSDLLAFGGVVSGMSGSPIYVDDGGVPKMIGAVSYGDAFTLRGTGLATPIQYLRDIEDTYAPQLTDLSFDEPIVTSTGVIDNVIITSDPKGLESLADENTMVASPLSTMFIGGLRPGDKAYKRLAAHLEKQGANIAPLSSGGLGGIATLDETLTAGSAVGILAAYGDLWYGGIGTVTYVNEDNVLAFGHPAFWEGETDMFMTNAWVDGVWSSSLFPYKVGRPAAIRGAFTQDRWAGIMGDEAAAPAETLVTASASSPDTSTTDTSSTVRVSRRYASSMTGDPFLAVFAAYPAGGRIYDSYWEPGSAEITTTVVVQSGEATYQVQIANLVDSDYDISFSVLDDAMRAVFSVLDVSRFGLESPELLSVDLQSRMTKQRRNGEIVGVDLVAPLAYGDNRVRVSILEYGVAATQTVDVTLTVPYDAENPTPLTGTISASGAGSSSSMFSDEYYEGGDSEPTPTFRKSVAQVVAELNDGLPANQLVVTFEPEEMLSTEETAKEEGSEEPPAEEVTYDPLTADTATGIVLDGSAEKIVPGITAMPSEATITYRGYTWIFGEILGASSGTVDIYGTYGGETTERLLAEDVPVTTIDGFTGYETPVGPLAKITNIRVVYSGNKTATTAQAVTKVNVRAYVALASPTRVRKGSTVTLTASVAPTATAGTTVQFQRYYYGRWVPVTTTSASTKTLTPYSSSYSRATFAYKLYGTTKFRVRYNTSASNIITYSSVRTISVY